MPRTRQRCRGWVRSVDPAGGLATRCAVPSRRSAAKPLAIARAHGAPARRARRRRDRAELLDAVVVLVDDVDGAGVVGADAGRMIELARPGAEAPPRGNERA